MFVAKGRQTSSHILQGTLVWEEEPFSFASVWWIVLSKLILTPVMDRKGKTISVSLHPGAKAPPDAAAPPTAAGKGEKVQAGVLVHK